MSKELAPDSESDDSDTDFQLDKKRIFLVPYPKFIFLYPTFLMSIVCTVLLFWKGYDQVGPNDVMPVVLTYIFLAILLLNLVVLVFDFPRASWLILIFFVISIALGLTLMFTYYPSLLPIATEWITSLRPVANTTFFACCSSIMGFMYFLVFISRWLNYWELRPNELLHHHGVLSDLKRYPAPNMRVDKEVNDVFEYLLLGSGRLIFQPSSERRAIILDNVPFVSLKERRIKKILSSIQVRVRTGPSTE